MALAHHAPAGLYLVQVFTSSANDCNVSAKLSALRRGSAIDPWDRAAPVFGKNAIAPPGISAYLFFMSMLLEKTSIISKTKELCAQIAEDAQFKKLQADVERFLADDIAKLQYKTVHEKGEELHHKQHAGVELGAAEIKAFEDSRDSLFDNKVAADFMDAQRTLESIQKDISKYVSMTLELGHVPSDDEIEEANNSGGGCCGGGGGEGCCG
jgi:cell fate (sporulation/competence/biofilm development) regulator YlbF (YheA/YmcA/DUF963 family)